MIIKSVKKNKILITFDWQTNHSFRIWYALGPVSLNVFCPPFKFDKNVAFLVLESQHFLHMADSTAVLSCAKICNDHSVRIETTLKRNFHLIWITMEKPLVKEARVWWSPGHMLDIWKKIWIDWLATFGTSLSVDINIRNMWMGRGGR